MLGWLATVSRERVKWNMSVGRRRVTSSWIVFLSLGIRFSASPAPDEVDSEAVCVSNPRNADVSLTHFCMY